MSKAAAPVKNVSQLQ
jgi:hypothetical protein